MHGLGAALRQFLHLAKPWQRMVVGVVLTVIGFFTGLYVVAAIGIVLVALPVVGWFKRHRAVPQPGGPTGAETIETTEHTEP
jgi:uncharacterized membrane protein YphA (DoxX/SURF4 family)